MLKMKDLKDQSVNELASLAHDISREIYGLRNEQSINRKLEKPHLVRAKKRDRARVLTVISQKDKNDGK